MVNQMISSGAPLKPDQFRWCRLPGKSAAEKPAQRRNYSSPVETLLKEWTVPTLVAPRISLLRVPTAALVHRTLPICLPLQPKTGEFKKYHTNIPHSGPHGLVEDKEATSGLPRTTPLCGKLDPKRGIYRIQDAQSGCDRPHTPLFDHNVFFSSHSRARI